MPTLPDCTAVTSVPSVERTRSPPVTSSSAAR